MLLWVLFETSTTMFLLSFWGFLWCLRGRPLNNFSSGLRLSTLLLEEFSGTTVYHLV